MEGESIRQYSAELRRLSTHFKFDTFLSQALRDRLICGLHSDSIQKKLLCEEKLSFERAMEISLEMEIADEPKEFKTGHSTNRVQASGPNSHKSTWSKVTTTPICIRCGKGPHSPDVCR